MRTFRVQQARDPQVILSGSERVFESGPVVQLVHLREVYEVRIERVDQRVECDAVSPGGTEVVHIRAHLLAFPG